MHLLLCLFAFLLAPAAVRAADPFVVIAYYSAGPDRVAEIDARKLTHIIYSFGHLKGNRFAIDNRKDSLTLQKLVELKKQNPALKVMVSLGGWGGCAPCSEVFSSEENRRVFSRSVRENLTYFGADGIDLDWEYPAIPGHPGHRYAPEDKPNFTDLVRKLRQELGRRAEISFAAGGFPRFIDEAVDWTAVMPLVDRVNIMTYDLVHGFSTATGHHTPLYSTPEQRESTDAAVQALLAKGVPARKLVIGAAFYTRMWEGVAPTNNGRYQPGTFKSSTAFRDFDKEYGPGSGFTAYWDDTARAPYLYNAAKQQYVTYDDPRSIALKTRYAREKGLNGIMFWELSLDKPGGLLDTIDRTKREGAR
ncbi:glycoside hydrolase family 18 protein [Tellurirhabdus rosea]|uniref:glycoside hydrolase family 18 protein n=1 Tax=Tellurirhabdus rosea TaxID=2674997 RepID=UPI00224D0E14|nr:glycoside hydrolase family 18 protein [Tellurirhabdus rosea]